MRKEARTRDDTDVLLRSLCLPAFVAYRKEVADQADKGGWSFDQYLHHLAELELEERKRRKTERILKKSCLPTGKTLAALDTGRLPVPVRRQIPALCEGGFVERAENLLAFLDLIPQLNQEQAAQPGRVRFGRGVG